jgi:ATP-dependent Clp protease ATP-binding subunit ClpA
VFEQFTEEARTAVRLAQEEARGLRHPSIGTEHILLALLEEGRGPAARALRDHGLVAADLRRRVLEMVDPDALDPEALAVIGIDLDCDDVTRLIPDQAA